MLEDIVYHQVLLLCLQLGFYESQALTSVFGSSIRSLKPRQLLHIVSFVVL